jgi:heme exporter protein B
MKAIWALLHKEFLIDWRDKQAWSAVVLYILATVYVVYLAFQQIVDVEMWNALLWIILLFTAFNVVARTYDQDKGGREIYLYTLAPPQKVFLTKSLYSALFILGFPVIIPLLIAIITYSEGILLGHSWSMLSKYALILGIMILLGIGLGYILFPYLWRD